jgi:pyridoxamine 5'-phosphate oxidase-like protein
MAGWSEVEAAAPELAAEARRLLDAHTHKTLATLRKDGSPRISGTEAQFEDGELWFGAMLHSVKALDLRRDPRFALHSGSDDPPSWTADAKVAGTVEEVETDGDSHRFRADVTEVVVVHLGDPADHIVIESWHPDRGLTRRERH